MTLDQLSRRDRDDVVVALTALEMAEQPVPATTLRALLDPALRNEVQWGLAASGRTLLQVRPNEWLSGYDDAVADRLVEDGVGVLDPADRAVLALVLLRTVAIPRSLGRITGSDWTQALPTTIDELSKNRHLTKTQITRSIRRLRTLGILRPGLRAEIRPGAQFLRFTAARNARIWEGLLLVCKPEGLTADIIRRRRTPAGATQ